MNPRETNMNPKPLAASIAMGVLILLAFASGSRAASASGHMPLLSDCPPDREFCLQADRSGSLDLQTGIAYLEGNVVGIVRSRNLSFQGGTLRAFRDGGDTWVRLVMEEDVYFRQAGQEARGDQGLLEEKMIRLAGNVSINQAEWSIEAHEAVIDNTAGTTSLSSLPGHSVRMTFRQKLVALPSESRTSGDKDDRIPLDEERSQPEVEGPTTRIEAGRAVLTRDSGEFALFGQVTIDQSDDSLHIQADQMTLAFFPDRTLKHFQADGNVAITQPGRSVTADHAATGESLETIVLTGNATLRQQDSFDLKADRLEVFLDATKGVIQSSEQEKPITLSLDLGKGQSFRLTAEGLTGLTNQGLPANTAGKLSPLVGRNYSSRTAFRKAVGDVLNPEETERHFDAIAKASR